MWTHAVQLACGNVQFTRIPEGGMQTILFRNHDKKMFSTGISIFNMFDS